MSSAREPRQPRGPKSGISSKEDALAFALRVLKAKKQDHDVRAASEYARDMVSMTIRVGELPRLAALLHEMESALSERQTSPLVDWAHDVAAATGARQTLLSKAGEVDIRGVNAGVGLIRDGIRQARSALGASVPSRLGDLTEEDEAVVTFARCLSGRLAEKGLPEPTPRVVLLLAYYVGLEQEDLRDADAFKTRVATYKKRLQRAPSIDEQLALMPTDLTTRSPREEPPPEQQQQLTVAKFLT